MADGLVTLAKQLKKFLNYSSNDEFRVIKLWLLIFGLYPAQAVIRSRKPFQAEIVYIPSGIIFSVGHILAYIYCVYLYFTTVQLKEVNLVSNDIGSMAKELQIHTEILCVLLLFVTTLNSNTYQRKIYKNYVRVIQLLIECKVDPSKISRNINKFCVGLVISWLVNIGLEYLFMHSLGVAISTSWCHFHVRNMPHLYVYLKLSQFLVHIKVAEYLYYELNTILEHKMNKMSTTPFRHRITYIN